jgi:hypothetical protein
LTSGIENQFALEISKVLSIESIDLPPLTCGCGTESSIVCANTDLEEEV